jgi:uncharacterized membrane protein YgaE (UPF0421/DUF939 family)
MEISHYVRRFGKLIDFNSSKVIHSFKTALACLIGYVLVLTTKLPEAQWIVITILVVMSAQPSIGSLYIKAKMRFWGTVLGAITAAITVLLFHDNHVELAFALFVVTLFFAYIAATPGDINYIGTLGAVTVVIIILFPGATLATAGERFIEIVLGIIISFLVSRFVFPIRSHTFFLKNLINTLSYMHEYLDFCLQPSSPAINERLFDMSEKMLTIFAQQRRLIHETGLEWGKLRKDKIIFKQAFSAERKIYRAINLMHYSFHADSESKRTIESLDGFTELKSELNQFLPQIAEKIKDGAVQDIRIPEQKLAERMENDLKKTITQHQYPNVAPVYTFLFALKFFLKELKILIDSVSKIKFS